MGRRRRPPPPGPCIHCLNQFEKLTWDHVFARAWYPDTTPDNLEKWEFPACLDCNQKYGALEADLLTRLGLCVDPKSAAAAGISEKALRSIKPEFAKNPKDRKLRQLKREKILREIAWMSSLPEEGYLPNFGPQPGVIYPTKLRVPVHHDQLAQLGTKLVRGITYAVDHKMIPPEYEIGVYFVENKNAEEQLTLLNRWGQSEHRGPGVLVTRMFSVDDPVLALYKIDIWGKLRIFASVLRAAIRPDGASA